jgi:hypothetical protein
VNSLGADSEYWTMCANIVLPAKADVSRRNRMTGHVNNPNLFWWSRIHFTPFYWGRAYDQPLFLKNISQMWKPAGRSALLRTPPRSIMKL